MSPACCNSPRGFIVYVQKGLPGSALEIPGLGTYASCIRTQYRDKT